MRTAKQFLEDRKNGKRAYHSFCKCGAPVGFVNGKHVIAGRVHCDDCFYGELSKALEKNPPIKYNA